MYNKSKKTWLDVVRYDTARLIMIKIGGIDMTGTTYRKLNMSKLSGRKHRIISSETALKDVVPIEWSDDVKAGKKKIQIK